jgi:hypothetical protein
VTKDIPRPLPVVRDPEAEEDKSLRRSGQLPPRKRISKDDKDALLAAGLTLLLIAGAAFFAGLL